VGLGTPEDVVAAATLGGQDAGRVTGHHVRANGGLI
jgi:hypothetical protein